MSTAATPARLMTDIDDSAYDPADINRLRAGDSAAVAAFVRNHEPAMRRLVGRITVWSDETDDIVQDVFATALVALPKFRGECEIETWLTRIAINRCRRHLRRNRLARAFFGRQPQREEPAATQRTDAPLERAETNTIVRRAIAALPLKYREVIVLRYLEERSAKETATLLGVRANTVDVRLHRARAMLETSLTRLMPE